MKPLVKYRGGKAREIPLFIKYVPEQFDTYYEPFLGGGAVFFQIVFLMIMGILKVKTGLMNLNRKDWPKIFGT